MKFCCASWILVEGWELQGYEREDARNMPISKDFHMADFPQRVILWNGSRRQNLVR